MVTINSVTEKDFHETEAGLIPAEWDCVTLGDVAKTKSGGTPSRKKPEYFGGEISWVKSGELNDTEIEFTEETITEQGLQKSSAKIFPQGTMLIALYGATVGKTAILSIDAATNQAVCAVFPDKRLIPQFLMYQFIARRDELLRERYGGAQPNISQTIVRAFQTIIPPLPEQKRIATVLNAIQDEIAAQEDIIRELREFKRSTMERLFTYGAGETPAETKVTEVGNIPAHWEVVELEKVVKYTQYGSSDRAEQNGQYPILRMNNMYDGKLDISDLKYVDFDDETFAKFKLNSDDVLFNRTNSYELVGKTALFDIDGQYVFASYIVRVETNKDRLGPQYLTYYLNRDYTQYNLKKLATRGASQSNISASKLKRFRIPLPPIEEQRYISKQLNIIDNKIAVEQDRKTALEDLFRSMLQQLMTGQIRLLSDEGLPI